MTSAKYSKHQLFLQFSLTTIRIVNTTAINATEDLCEQIERVVVTYFSWGVNLDGFTKISIFRLRSVSQGGTSCVLRHPVMNAAYANTS